MKVIITTKPETTCVKTITVECAFVNKDRKRTELLKRFDKLRSQYNEDLSNLKSEYLPKFQEILDELEAIV